MIVSISSLRMRRTYGSGAMSAGDAVGDHEGLAGADLPGRAPVGLQQPPQLGGRFGGADDGGAAAARSPGPVGEGADRSWGRADRDQVVCGVAEGREHAVLVPAPHLAAEPPRVEADLDPRRHEGVRNRLTVEDGERRVQVARFEDPGGRLGQHGRSLTLGSADLRTVPAEAEPRRPEFGCRSPNRDHRPAPALKGQVLAALRDAGEDAGLRQVIAPVRPTAKAR